jgi:hypothetical protein
VVVRILFLNQCSDCLLRAEDDVDSWHGSARSSAEYDGFVMMRHKSVRFQLVVDRSFSETSSVRHHFSFEAAVAAARQKGPGWRIPTFHDWDLIRHSLGSMDVIKKAISLKIVNLNPVDGAQGVFFWTSSESIENDHVFVLNPITGIFDSMPRCVALDLVLIKDE